MKVNRLGTSDLMISEVGFGTMSLPQNEQEAIYIIHEALDRGVNFIDTADLYDYGRIETVIGKALKGRRDHVIIATKAGNRWEPGKPGWRWDPSKAYIKEAVKGSLKRLGTDYIDLYQLHGGTLEDPIDETIEAFEELKSEGWIRWYGISSIRPNVIREYVARSNIVSVMMQYSILDRRPEESVLELLAENKVSVIARGPIAKGLLSDNGEHKVTEKGYLDYSADELRELIPRLKAETNARRSLSETAIRYILSQPAVAVTIPGASRLDQLVKNIQAADAPPLSGEELDAIRRLTKANRYENHR
ncbi:aldo/keto reductase [Camelliibacillus cellulosilyticus]|uniref:Aldo/keto reductase n=1 Tax=Camelliibacillus cellulosilyticus TaxID=2174486 RepID=A0ABV9GLY5_9BACL